MPITLTDCKEQVMELALKKKIETGIQSFIRQAEKTTKADQFTRDLIRSGALAALKRLREGTFGNCTCCSTSMFATTLQQNPVMPYCDNCEARFGVVRAALHSQLTSVRQELNQITLSTKNVLRNDSVKTIGKDPGDAVSPDMSIPTMRSVRLSADIHQMEEILLEIAKGTYNGTCGKCEEDIPIGRLRAKPHARFCVSCADFTQKHKR